MHAERTDDRHTLFLTAGKLSRIAGCLICQTDSLQKLHSFCFYLILFPLLHLDRGKRDIVKHGQMWKQLVALEYHSDLLPHFGNIFAALADILAMQADRTVLHGL